MNETLWIAVLVALTMGLTRLAKFWPRLPKGLVPLLAVAIGAGLYLAKAVYLDSQPLADAWQSWLVVLVGAGAVVGHDLLKPALTELVGEPLATILLGRIPGSAERPKPPPRKPPASTIFVAILLGGLLGGCAPALAALQGLVRSTQGSQWLGSVLDVAETGAAAYFDRHPSIERQQDVAQAIRVARQAQEALDRVLAAVDAVESGDAEKARSEALTAYASLRALLAELGVLTATPPPGGAEGNAPSPVPLLLPTVAEVDARL